MPPLDDLARRFSQASRRTVLGALIAVVTLSPVKGEAKNTRKKRRKKKRNSCAWPCDPDAFELYVADVCANPMFGSEEGCLRGAKRCLAQYGYLYFQGYRKEYREYALNCIDAYD